MDFSILQQPKPKVAVSSTSKLLKIKEEQKMPIYYVKPDTNNQFPDKDTTPALEPADGLRTVNIPN